MPTEIPGINMLVAQGGTAIIDQTDATLTTTPELAETVTKNTNFVNRLPGDQDWQLEFEGQIPEMGGADALTNGNAGLDVEVDLGSGAAFEPVEGIQSLTVTLDQELSEVSPGINEPVGWSYYVPLRQDWEIEPEGHYYDPANSSDAAGVMAAIHTARDNGNSLPAEVSVLGVTFAGDIVADEFEVAAGTDDPASQSLPFMGTGELTQSSSFETTIEALVNLYFTQSTATVGLRHEEGGSVVTGSTFWNGDAYLESAEITLERDSFPVISATFQGDGPLDRTTQ